MPTSPRCPAAGVGWQVGDRGWRERVGARVGALVRGVAGRVGRRGRGEVGAGTPWQHGCFCSAQRLPRRGQGQAGRRRGKAWLLQHPPLPAMGCSAQLAAGRWAEVPPPQVHGCLCLRREVSGARPWGAGGETPWARSWRRVARATSGPGGPEQRGFPKYVPAAPCWPWEKGLVGLTQLFGGGQGPSRDWGRNCFLLCVHLGWKKREAGGEPGQAPHAAGAMGRSLSSSGRPCCCHFGGKTGRDSPPDACRVLKPPTRCTRTN